jgi:hypothetical protein
MTRQLLAAGRLGQDLKQAAGSDFFQFFHLRVADTAKEPDGGTVCLRPVSPQFRDRVALYASVDPQGRFLELELRIDRSVIDDNDTEQQARDIVKSFLQDAIPQEDVLAIRDWIVDIYYRPTLSQQSVSTSEMSPDDLSAFIKMQIDAGKAVSASTRGRGGATPALPESPTVAFEVFIGEMEACEQDLPHSCVRLNNAIVGSIPVLRISVSPAAS